MPAKMRDTIDDLGIAIVNTVGNTGNDTKMSDADLMRIVSNVVQLVCIGLNTLDRIADAVEAQAPRSPVDSVGEGLN